MPGSVLSTGMPSSVLMREQTSLQHQRSSSFMTGSEYMVEHRNFENWSSALPITFRSERGSLLNSRDRGIPARHFRARLFPRPFLTGWVWGPDYGLSQVLDLDMRMALSLIIDTNQSLLTTYQEHGWCITLRFFY